MRTCTTHHHACDCREALMARVVATFESYVEASEFHMKGMLGDPEQELVDAQEVIAEWKEAQ